MQVHVRIANGENEGGDGHVIIFKATFVPADIEAGQGQRFQGPPLLRQPKAATLKLRCDTLFQRAFTACGCVFKIITLV